ncbi:hypothetical protein [Aeromonas veronii]|uniref:hypothetical protein n=1 Tax=Aeromonas veronii TaxID=654 RepID=UPI002444D34D|nr:hypothetical protein [Aeromonas veronii]
MDLFILLFSCNVQLMLIERGAILSQPVGRTRQGGMGLRQALARSKNSHHEKVSGFGDNGLKVTSFRHMAGFASVIRSNSSRNLQGGR